MSYTAFIAIASASGSSLRASKEVVIGVLVYDKSRKFSRDLGRSCKSRAQPFGRLQKTLYSAVIITFTFDYKILLSAIQVSTWLRFTKPKNTTQKTLELQNTFNTKWFTSTKRND